MSDDRMRVVVMGRMLGTASGWDQVSDHGICFYDFKSDFLSETLPDVGALTVDMDTGIIEGYTDGNEEPVYRYDAVQILNHLYRDTPMKEKRVLR